MGVTYYNGKFQTRSEGAADLIDGLFEIAVALNSVAHQLQYLGNGNAASENGAIEGLSMQLREGFSEVAAALESLRPLEVVSIDQ